MNGLEALRKAVDAFLAQSAPSGMLERSVFAAATQVRWALQELELKPKEKKP